MFIAITAGNNAFTYNAGDDNFVTIPGYAAKKGWDPATGWGSRRPRYRRYGRS